MSCLVSATVHGASVLQKMQKRMDDSIFEPFLAMLETSIPWMRYPTNLPIRVWIIVLPSRYTSHITLSHTTLELEHDLLSHTFCRFVSLTSSFSFRFSKDTRFAMPTPLRYPTRTFSRRTCQPRSIGATLTVSAT
jgi:hypothetical protein